MSGRPWALERREMDSEVMRLREEVKTLRAQLDAAHNSGTVEALRAWEETARVYHTAMHASTVEECGKPFCLARDSLARHRAALTALEQPSTGP